MIQCGELQAAHEPEPGLRGEMGYPNVQTAESGGEQGEGDARFGSGRINSDEATLGPVTATSMSFA